MFVYLRDTFIYFFKDEAKQLQLIVLEIGDYESVFSELELLKMKISQSNSMINIWEIIHTSTSYPRAQGVYNYLFAFPGTVATNE